MNKVLEKEEIVQDQEEEDYDEEENYDKGYIEDFSDEDEEGEEGNEDEDDEEVDDIFNTSTAKTRSSGKYINKKRENKINYEYEKEYENSGKKVQTNEQIDF